MSREGDRERSAWRWCRGAELNCLRRPFQGRALPVSYPGTVGNLHFRQNAWSRKAKSRKKQAIG